jgi:hypothetical protein
MCSMSSSLAIANDERDSAYLYPTTSMWNLAFDINRARGPEDLTYTYIHI